MSAYSVQARRAWLRPSKSSKTDHRSAFAHHFEKGHRFLIACLAVAAALVVGAVAQDSRSSSTGASSVSTPEPSPPATATTNSQDPASSPQSHTEEGQFVFKKKVEEVVLHAVVVDPENHLMSALNREAFRVFENGKPQKMTSFRHENVHL